MALLKITGPALVPLRIRDSDSVREGQEVYFTGFPIGAVLGPFPATHRGMISVVTPIAIPQGRAADLDPRMREQLQQFRTTLQTFFAGTLGPSRPNAVTQPPAAPVVAAAQTPGQAPTPTASPSNSAAADLGQTSDAMALLNRIDDIVTQALKDTPATSSATPAASPAPVGTSGASTVRGAASNKVSIERDKLDEIRAEIQQLKAILKK